MKSVFCMMQTYVLLTALLQIYQSKPNLPEKTDGYRKKRTGAEKNGQVPGKTDRYRKKCEITGKIVYIPELSPLLVAVITITLQYCYNPATPVE